MGNELSREVFDAIQEMKYSAFKAVEVFDKLTISQETKDEIATTIYFDMGIMAGKIVKILDKKKSEDHPHE